VKASSTSLKGRAKKPAKPFCMFVSLVNPHDIGVFPGNKVTPPAWQQAGFKREHFANLGIKLPPNYADDLFGRQFRQIRSARRAGGARGLRQLLGDCVGDKP
jgi:choline-sulfatase